MSTPAARIPLAPAHTATPDATPADMRERILRTTLQLIASDGYSAITNRRVAVAAGVSLGSLTYHFSSQAELLRESLMLYVEEETARREGIARELAARNADLEEIAWEIEQLAGAGADMPRQIAELELHLLAARDPRLTDASQRCFAAHEQIAAAALACLGVEESERHAHTVVALMTGLAIRRLAGAGNDAQGTSQSLLALMHGLTK
jgi:AcrR family transcriptional regulator